MTIASEKAKEFILKYKDNKNITKKELARLLYSKYPKIFKSIEQARQNIRYLTGSHGKSSRAKISRTNKVTIGAINNYNYLINELPEAVREQKSPYCMDIPVKGLKGIVFGDVHMGWHMEEMLAQMIHYGRIKDINCIIINGDLMDNHDLSRFLKDPSKRTFWYELQETKKFLGLLRYYFPSAKIVINEGNHDARYKKYIFEHAPALADVEYLDLDLLIGCPEYNIHFYKGGRGIMLQNYMVFHGHEFGVGGGKNPAKNFMNSGYTNMIISHVHKTDYAQVKTANNEFKVVHTIGCMSQLDPDYRAVGNGYNNGFLYFETTPKGLNIKNWNLNTDTLI